MVRQRFAPHHHCFSLSGGAAVLLTAPSLVLVSDGAEVPLAAPSL